ncbi:hypothetical protein NAPIS_ORF01592 [Vairimorpha apis BRL 01]|uniref:Uncharacterized protein n=1 Tax=Vairimorpha apis BRL 01 TaxID=1037528 RepID=T0MIL9_9MICR|nr:hypothetical protein NAPIS_ORF01592 [Vairimorpha apis BRL 01]
MSLYGFIYFYRLSRTSKENEFNIKYLNDLYQYSKLSNNKIKLSDDISNSTKTNNKTKLSDDISNSTKIFDGTKTNSNKQDSVNFTNLFKYEDLIKNSDFIKYIKN